MVFWKRELRNLSASERRFEDIFRIFSEEFTDTIFAEQYRAGRTVRTSYAELTALTNRIARVLHARFSGSEGAFLAIKMENSPLWVAAFFGVLQAGFRPLLLNLRLDEQSLRELSAEALAVLTDRPEEGCVDLSSCGDAPEFSPCWANEIALFTSGTTGQSKRILYSGAAICAQLLQTEDIVRRCPQIKHDRLARGIRILAFLPFYHIFGLMATLLWFIFFGTTFIFLESLDANHIQFTCKYGRVTHFFAVPTVWDLTARQLVRTAEKQGQLETLRRGVKLSNRLQSVFPRFGGWAARNLLFKKVREQVFGTELMFSISGGGFLRPETLELMNALGYGLRNGYGMTETGILSVELSPRASRRNSGTVGLPLTAVGKGGYRLSREGVLELNTPLLYTAQIIDGKRVERDPQAWFSTGDCFRVDATGRWYITGRKGDLIIGANGENLSPDLIEQRLNLHAGLASCVFGMELDGDERAVLLVQLPENPDAYTRASAAQAAFAAVDGLPLTLRPARVYFTEQEIPQNLGKTRRAILKERIASGEIVLTAAARTSAAELTALEDESLRALTQELCSLIAEVTGAAVEPGTHVLNDLGVDSMTYYAIFSAIAGRYGVQLAMDAAQPLYTPRDFAAALLRERGAQA